MTSGETILFDAGLFIAALLSGDPRHAEAYHWLRRRAVELCQSVPRLAS